MKTVGFLACETTLPSTVPGTRERRGDAYEHDLMIAALEPALADAGLALAVIDWEAPPEAFDKIDLVLLGTAWNYQDKPDAFLARLEALEQAGVAVCNPAQVVRWNTRKTYLRALAKQGASTIPTLWRERIDAAEAASAMEALGCEQLVIKRQVGAGALGQELLTLGQVPADWRFDHPAMLQPFLPAICTEGEISFVFIDGELSHALRKLPASGDYRIQSLYGGREIVHQPADDEARAAAAIISALRFDAPLYARVDMVRMDDGALAVMEAELIEPYLYPQQGPDLGPRIARAITRRLQQ